MNKIRTTLAGLTMMAAVPCSLFAQSLIVKPTAPIAPIQPTMYGIFFEDINFAADGGLYAELIKNRSFEFYKPQMGWKVENAAAIDGTFLINKREKEKPSNPRYASIIINDKTVSMINEGFRGMGIKQGNQYNFSMLANVSSSPIKVTVELLNSKGESIGKSCIGTHVCSRLRRNIAPASQLRKPTPKGRSKYRSTTRALLMWI